MLQCHALCGARVLSCVFLYVRYAALRTTGRRAECDPALCAFVPCSTCSCAMRRSVPQDAQSAAPRPQGLKVEWLIDATGGRKQQR